MKEFNHVEMTEEELDQVAGGQQTATFELLEDGSIKVIAIKDTIKVFADGSPGQIQIRDEMKLKSEKSFQRWLEYYKKQGYEIIFKGFEGI